VSSCADVKVDRLLESGPEAAIATAAAGWTKHLPSHDRRTRWDCGEVSLPDRPLAAINERCDPLAIQSMVIKPFAP
jgi:hypothetical protein